MKERPILFSAPMVRAILAGTKTQTRRLVKVPSGYSAPNAMRRWTETNFVGGRQVWIVRKTGDCVGPAWKEIFFPYGDPGDRLWVREAWRCHAVHDHVPGSELGGSRPAAVQYVADGFLRASAPWGRMRHARFMPRWASRITLEVISRRVERLKDISEDDAIAESAPWTACGAPQEGSHKAGFAHLWESINGPGFWDTNPWVWVLEFKRVDDAKQDAKG